MGRAVTCLEIHTIEAAHSANYEPGFEDCLHQLSVLFRHRPVVLKP